MSQEITERQNFINQCRRESRWAILWLAFGAVTMIAVPMFLGTTTLGLAGALLLTALFVCGIVHALIISRGDDNAVLRDASRRHLGAYALIIVGMAMFSFGNQMDSGWIIGTAVVLTALQGNAKRVAKARSFLLNANEKMRPVSR